MSDVNQQLVIMGAHGRVVRVIESGQGSVSASSSVQNAMQTSHSILPLVLSAYQLWVPGRIFLNGHFDEHK